jgi:hypothetical protein
VHLEYKAIVPVSDGARAKIIAARTERTRCNDDGLELLYPDIEMHHAIIALFKAARGRSFEQLRRTGDASPERRWSRGSTKSSTGRDGAVGCGFRAGDRGSGVR